MLNYSRTHTPTTTSPTFTTLSPTMGALLTRSQTPLLLGLPSRPSATLHPPPSQMILACTLLTLASPMTIWQALDLPILT